MKVLIIGGTRFVGRHIAQAAIERDHDVTLFHRGLTGRTLFPEAEHVLGDRRRGGRAHLVGRSFDAIIDTTAYHPADVREAAAICRETRYVLISSVSAYRDPVPSGADESAPLWTLTPPIPREHRSAEEYGGLKALCELEAQTLFGDLSLIVRPGLIIGPHDWSGRLSSWLHRLRDREIVLAAERAQPIQLIDARDLARWLVLKVEERLTGTFNAVGPLAPVTMAEFLENCSQIVGSNATLHWAGDEFIARHDVPLPFWLPVTDAGLFSLSSRRARDAGLRSRALTDSVADVFAAEDDADRLDIDVGPFSDAQEDAWLREAGART